MKTTVGRTKYVVNDGVGSNSERVVQSLKLLKSHIDLLEWSVAKKREAHRRLLLQDLLIIEQNLAKEKVNNGVSLLIERFNEKIVHSLRATSEYNQETLAAFLQLLDDIDYTCNELTDRLVLDASMADGEKVVLGKELYQFRKDAKAHIEAVDNFNYELREMVRGVNLKVLRGLTKDEYKKKIREIIRFIEEVEVPLHVFKSVGFNMQRNDELVVESSQSSNNAMPPAPESSYD